MNILHRLTFSDIVGLTTGIITICITIWSVLYVKKSKFYFLEQKNLKLYEDFAKKIKDISITFKGEEIIESLIFVSGAIIYKGYSDIKKEDIDKNLTITCQDTTSVWKYFEIKNSLNTFSTSFKIDKNRVKITRSLVKRYDIFSFSGILDSKSNVITIGHRIFNVIPETITLKQEDSSSYKSAGIFSFITAILMLSVALIVNDRFVKEKNEIAESKVKKERKNLSPSKYDYELQFLNKGKAIDIDSLSELAERKNRITLDSFIKINNREIDSLNTLNKNHPSLENENIALKKIIERHDFVSNLFVDNYLQLKITGNLKLDTLLVNKSLSKKPYKLNDTISVKYLYKAPYKEPDLENNYYKTDFTDMVMLITAYCMFVLSGFYSFRLWNKYFIIQTLKRRYKNHLDSLI